MDKPGQEQGRAGMFPVQLCSLHCCGDLAQILTLCLVDELAKVPLEVEIPFQTLKRLAEGTMSSHVSKARHSLLPH